MEEKIFNEEALEKQLETELSLHAHYGEQYQKGFRVGYYSGVTYAYVELFRTMGKIIEKKKAEIREEELTGIKKTREAEEEKKTREEKKKE